jgi:hypothetical protein
MSQSDFGLQLWIRVAAYGRAVSGASCGIDGDKSGELPSTSGTIRVLAPVRIQCADVIQGLTQVCPTSGRRYGFLCLLTNP